MKRLSILLATVLVGSFLGGCSSEKSDLTKDEKVQMDKLFREGIKPPPGNSPQAGTPPAPGSTPGPMNPETG